MKDLFNQEKKIRYRSGRLIVGLDTRMSESEVRKLIIGCGGLVESINKPNVADVTCPPHEAQAVLDKLKALKGKGVRFAEFDHY